MSRPWADALRPWAWPALVVVAAVLVYLPVVGFPLVWTDHAEIEDGRLVPQSLAEVAAFLSKPKGEAKEASTGARQAGESPRGLSYYRPLKALSYGLDHAVGGGEPWSFHATNLLLHALSCLALYALGRRLLAPGHTALAGALAVWQALSPLHAETVCWVSARSDSLVALSGLLASLALLRSRVARPWAFRGLAALAAGLGLLAKETGLAIFPWLVVLSACLPDPARPRPLRRVAVECAPALLVGAALCLLRVLWVGDVHPGALPRASLGAFSMMHLFGDNLLLSLAPLGLRLADTVAIQDGPTLLGVVGPFAWLAWLGLGLRLRREAPAVLLGALGWLLSVAPVSQLVPLLHARGERYLYLPAMFAGLSLAWVVGWVAARLRSRLARGAGALAGIAYLALLGLWAHERALAWGDERRLFARAVADEPACAECWNNLAYARGAAGDLPGAIRASQRALAVDRTRVRTYLDGYSARFLLARAALDLGAGEGAVPVVEQLWLRAGPTPIVIGLAAEAYLQAGRPAHALDALARLGPAGERDPRLAALARVAAAAEREAGFPSLWVPPGCYPSGPPVF